MRLLPILKVSPTELVQRIGGLRLRLKHAISPPRPKQMIIDVCATCNALCPFCPRLYMPEDRTKGVMAPEIFERCVAEAKAFRIPTIRLYSVAEPTLHPKFDEYVAALKREGFFVSVSTNASTLTRHLDSLSTVDMLQYSIEGWDQTTYEKFRYPLKYDRVRGNIAAFWEHAQGLKTRPTIVCNLLLTKQTDVQAFVDCWGPFVDQIKVSFLVGTTRFQDGKFISQNNPQIQDDYFDTREEQYGFCSYPFDVVTVSYDGKIALCCEDFAAELALGHISDGLETVLESQALKRVREQFYRGRLDTCAGCGVFRRPTEADSRALSTRIAALPDGARRKIALVRD